MGHSFCVMSLDFHPNKDDLICSCDSDGQIRYWSINNGSCSSVFKVESCLFGCRSSVGWGNSGSQIIRIFINCDLFVRIRVVQHR